MPIAATEVIYGKASMGYGKQKEWRTLDTLDTGAHLDITTGTPPEAQTIQERNR